ncbi:MAG: carbohydrate binding family 9 domain-containing protein, partial [bacterium]
AEPSENTEILIGYDETYLYVAARCYDKEPDKIQSPSRKRDELSLTNDWFGIVLDTFNDKENALAFFTTPAGLRLDMSVFDDAVGDFPINETWNTFWDVATEKNQKGWFLEMRIPFSSLRFQDDEGQVVMGLMTWRWIARKREVIIFPAVHPDWGFWSKFKSSRAQEISFQDLHSRRPLYIVPYILGGRGETNDLNEDETDYVNDVDFTREIGLDVKYGLTSNLTLDLTLNTDFAQIEADDQQINLTRFSLFFPEKRLFFQERSSNFEFNFGEPNRLFYSRRIGIYEDIRIPIYGGLRIVGRTGPWDVGFINMQTAPVDSILSENFTVLRLRRQVFNPFSYLGGIITNRIDTDGIYNTAYGLDGIFRVYGNDYLSMKWAQTFDNTLDNVPVSLDQARINVNWQRRTLKGVGYNFIFDRAGKNYNPGMGFELRENYTQWDAELLYGWIHGESGKFLRQQVYLEGFVVTKNENGKTESAEIGPEWEFLLKSGHNGGIEFRSFFEAVEDSFSFSDDADIVPGTYNFYGISGYYSTPFTGLFYVESNFYAGTFYDGNRFTVGVSPYWNMSSFLNLSAYYQFNRIDLSERNQNLNAHIARFRALFMFSTKLSFSAFIQYNSTGDVVITNFRLRYNPREGNDLYLVYDEGLNLDRDREVPVLPQRINRSILLKYSYTFNLSIGHRD